MTKPIFKRWLRLYDFSLRSARFHLRVDCFRWLTRRAKLSCAIIRRPGRIKQTYRAILVDEFQDTDPVQYEIILYLGERAGSHQTAWHDVDLEPGKLFSVGDPKQSIYAFRRADIEAFERVVEKIRASGGGVYSLVTNFRRMKLC